MSRSVNASRMIGLLLVLMAAMVVLSGPVAEVLDLPSPVAEAKKKHKKKKKRPPAPAFNVVQCPTVVEPPSTRCEGTAANDYLIGGPEDRQFGGFDAISGEGGNDVYNGGNGSDFLRDSSTMSSDVYLFPSTEFSASGVQAFVDDNGGDSDIVGLSSYGIGDFEVSRIGARNLLLDGPEGRDIVIFDFFDGGIDEGKIELFLFREGYFTGDQVASGATESTPEEQATLKQRLPKDERSSRDEVSSQQESERDGSPDSAGSQAQTK